MWKNGKQVTGRNVRIASAIRQTMERVARALAGRPLKVIWHHADRFPGYTDGTDIYLSEPLVHKNLNKYADEEGIARTVLSFKGLVYHELGHILFTPRSNEGYVRQWNLDSQQFTSFNALEDQRLETLFAATYPPASEYFTATVARYMTISKSSDLKAVYPLIYGRKFLPPQLIQASREHFAAHYGNMVTETLEEVIDDYLEVTYPRDALKAYSLIKRFTLIFTNNQIDQPTFGEGVMGDDHRSFNQGEANKQAQSVALNELKEKDSEDKDDDLAKAKKKSEDKDGDKPSDADGDDAEDGGEADDQGQQDGATSDADDGDADGAGGDDDGEAGDGNTDDDANSAGGNGEDSKEDASKSGDNSGDSESTALGDGGVGSKRVTTEELRGVAAEVLSELLDEESGSFVAADVAAMSKAVLNSAEDVSNFTGGHYGTSDPTLQEPSVATLQVARKITKEIKKLKLELEPERKHRQMAGRINPRRAMTADDHEVDVFDLWDDSDEESGGVEAVILVDLSGSMGSVSRQLSESLWVMKRAFDTIDARTTVLGFGADTYNLYPGREKAHKAKYRLYYASDPSTFALEALRAANGVLRSSKLKNRVLVTITDGSWNDSSESVRVAEAISQLPGTTTMFVGLGQYVQEGETRGHRFGVHLATDQIGELAPMVGGLVQNIMRKAVRDR